MVSCVVKCLNGDVLTFPQCDMVVDVKAKVAKRMGTLYMYVWLLADDDTVTLVHEDNALPPPCVYAVVNEPHYWHNPQYEDAAHDRDTHPYPDILRKLTRYWDNGATLTHLARLKAIRVHAREGARAVTVRWKYMMAAWTMASRLNSWLMSRMHVSYLGRRSCTNCTTARGLCVAMKDRRRTRRSSSCCACARMRT
eukprot:GEMP01050161.1.p1 GENE.GEMP01050161.1~~GEMP01050161.1.p1  ORF type:complete len:196 (+),score=54.12 GEMP01050161.1:109-696(+)